MVAIIQEGTDTLPMCDHCGMHMPSDGLLKHRWTEICNKATEMQLRQREAETAERCRDIEFSLYERERDALVKVVATSKYLGCILDQTDYDCPAIRWNIKQARKVWKRSRKILGREGENYRVAAMFYRAVT